MKHGAFLGSTKRHLISNDRQQCTLGKPGEAYPALYHHREHRHGHESNPVLTRFVDTGVHPPLWKRVAVRRRFGGGAVDERVFLSALR